MAVLSGYSTEAIRQAIEDALVGKTLTASGWDTITLTVGEDDNTPTLGAQESIHGSVTVTHDNGRTVNHWTAGRSQFQWERTFRIEVTYEVRGVSGSGRRAAASAFCDQIIQHLKDGLMDGSTTNYNVIGMSQAGPVRSAGASGYYVQVFTITIDAPDPA